MGSRRAVRGQGRIGLRRARADRAGTAIRLLTTVALAALLAGCGASAPDQLSRKDSARLSAAREDLSDALETAETIRTDPAERKRILREVDRLVATGAFEAKKLDEFGLASLGELAQVVPSVVITDADGVPIGLDRRGLREFRRRPLAALKRLAGEEVDGIATVVGDSGADAKTRVSSRESVGAYLRSVARDVEPVWPDLAKRVADLP